MSAAPLSNRTTSTERWFAVAHSLTHSLTHHSIDRPPTHVPGSPHLPSSCARSPAAQVDMFRVIRCFLRERRRRHAEGWGNSTLPFRPDHGHQMLDDLNGDSHMEQPWSSHVAAM